MIELNYLNEFLSEFRLKKHKTYKKKNIFFIVGLPRCGSTLLQQILISRYKVGYVSNIIGKFWANPIAGSILHSSLDDGNYMSNFFSEYGNTNGPFEPCEFGWFWEKNLKINLENDFIGSEVNWDYINETLQGMASVFLQPLIFDTPLICNQISKISENIDGVKFIYLKRNLKSVCNSILAARKKRFGNINCFYGAKPKTWAEINKIKDPIVQVIQQVHDLKREIEIDLKVLPSNDVFNLDISLLRDKPQEVADEIAHFINIEGLPREVDYPIFSNRDNLPFFDKKLEVKFKEAWDVIFHNEMIN